jgi:tetratricopeptide (TPR) repeat protein
MRLPCAAALATGALVLLIAGVAWPSRGFARGLPYGEVSAPDVQRCDQLNWSTRHAEARSCYRLLADSGAGAAAQAEGAWALGQLSRANDLFRAAVNAHPDDAALRVRWGELYIDSHQPQQALELFKEALQRNPHSAYARVGEASVLADDDEGQAEQSMNAVLQDPQAPAGAHLRALLLGARMALEDGDSRQTQSLLDRADRTASQAGLPALEIDALRAALAQSQGADGSMWITRALRIDPAFGEAYATPAHFLDIKWREADAIALFRKAVAVQPDLWSAQVQLASCLLREEQVGEARAHLQIAYQGDPFDPVTVNTLRLLDSLRDYQVLRYGHGPNGGPALILRVSRAEAPVLAPYASRLAEQALQLYTQRYHFPLRAPVVLEIEPNHDDLAVRTAGLPGLGGELGVTFGYVVAIDSPAARAEGASDWGSTLWHELAHVFTLESTDFRVPRWLTEGLSVFEEWRSGPIKGIEVPDYVFVAFARGRALPIAQLNRGFTHPQYPNQLLVSYMQAGLVCDYIDRTFGAPKLLALLHAFESTSDVSTALQRSLGLSAPQFDARFHADLLAHYGKLLEHIDDWQSARSAAAQALSHQDWSGAVAAARAALQLQPQDVEEGSPYLPLARGYQGSGQDTMALATLQDYWQRGGHDPQALRTLAQQLQRAGRLPEAIAVLESGNYVAPFDATLHGLLGDWLLQARRASEALDEYRVALALDPPDEANAHLRLARAEFALNQLPDAHREVLAALEVAPDYAPAQRLLLQIARATGRLPAGPPQPSGADAAPAPPPRAAPLPAPTPSAPQSPASDAKGPL